MSWVMVRRVLAVVFIVIVRPGFGEALFDYSCLPAARHKELQEAFTKAFDCWKTEKLDDERFIISSDTYVYWTGECAVTLARLSPASASYIDEAMIKDGDMAVGCGASMRSGLGGSPESL